jgi:hypothetical protein
MMAYKNYKYTTDNFLDSQRGTVMLYYPKDGGDALRPEYMIEALSIHKNLTESLTGAELGADYNTLCQRVSAELPCDFFNILGIFNYDSSTIQTAADAGAVHSTIQSFSTSTGAPLKVYLGGMQEDETTGDLTGASVIRMTWPHNEQNTTDPLRLADLNLEAKDFEATIQDKYLWEWRDTSSRLGNIDMLTTRSIDDEIGRLIQVDSVLFVMSIMAIVFILCMSLVKSGPNCCVNSRVVVGTSAFVIIMFSIVFAFGMMGHLGLSLNSVCTLICFVVAGVGVDDMIVVENFFQKAVDAGIPRGERMNYALRHGGLSVFLTSSSSVLAFLSGVGLDIPGIAQFCTVGALCFSWIWFQSITFFPAVLVLDQSRIEAKKVQCQCCCIRPPLSTAAEKEEGPPPNDEVKSTAVGETLTPILTSPVFRLLIPLIFSAIAGLNGYATTLNGTGLSVTDVVPDDSYIVELTETTNKFWTGKVIRGMILVFKGDHYSDAAKVIELTMMRMAVRLCLRSSRSPPIPPPRHPQVQDMNEYFAWAESLDYIIGTVGGSQSTWYKDYISYLTNNSKDPYADFSANLVPFLSDPLYKKWRASVTCTTDYDTCTEIKCAKFDVVQTSKIDTFELYGIQMEVRGARSKMTPTEHDQQHDNKQSNANSAARFTFPTCYS